MGGCVLCVCIAWHTNLLEAVCCGTYLMVIEELFLPCNDTSYQESVGEPRQTPSWASPDFEQNQYVIGCVRCLKAFDLFLRGYQN